MTSTTTLRRRARTGLLAGGLTALAVVLALTLTLLLDDSPLAAHSPTHRAQASLGVARAPEVSRGGLERAATEPVASLSEQATGTHLMMDMASAPALRTVRRWQRTSPYRAIGVYVHVARPVDDRFDKVQRHLTASWVAHVRAGGWNVLPIYLGAQAPRRCQSGGFHAMSADPIKAERQGIAAADVAALSTAKLGLSTAPVVYDMEQYGAGCGAAVRSFFLGWTARLHQLGRRAGIYGSPTSLGRDLLHAGADYVQPDVLWAVTANGSASTAVRALPSKAWRGRRANQFALDVTRRYGGKRLHVDDSVVDDGVWTPPRTTAPDTAAPILTAGASTDVVTGKHAALRWAAVDDVSARVALQMQVRRTASGQPAAAWSAPVASARTVRLQLRAGEQVCVRMRASDTVGNATGWSRQCTSRLADDGLLRHGHGWHRTRARDAYRHTVTTARRRHAVLRLGHAEPGAVGVLLRGRGAVAVRVGGQRVGTLRAGGMRWAQSPRAGAVTLVARSAQVGVDGFVLTPR